MNLNFVESLVSKFRQQVGLSDAEAVNLKSLLLKLNVLTIYRPLSESFSGMSLKSDTRCFMLINSNQPRCRQHFTIAHELYHLFVETNPQPHKCGAGGKKNESEKYADAFALVFLMPAAGVRQLIPDDELKSKSVSLASVVRIGHYFSVSHKATLNRLYDLRLIDRTRYESYLRCPVKKTAREYGYSTILYESGNTNLVIGSFGEKAKNLFDAGKISEGHYLELMRKIGIYDNED